MTDRRKVIEALRRCSTDTPRTCRGCPFNRMSAECITDLQRAALELIEGGQQELGNGDFVSRQYLLAEYDRQHQGPPGGARKIIAEAPAADVIDRREAIEAACKGFCHPGVRCPEEPCREQTKFLRELPSIEIVHCRECEFRDNDDGFCTGRGWPCQLVPDDGFCDKGKRREEQTNNKT